MNSSKSSNDSSRLALLAAGAAAIAATTSLLILKRKRWNSEKEDRQAYQDEMAKLVGPNPQMRTWENLNYRTTATRLTTHYKSATSSNNKVTVVLVHGFGCTSMEFKAVHELVKQQHPDVDIFNYDRVLFAKDDIHHPRDATMLALELRALLKVEPPFVLVGHSYGGLIAQMFASMLPHEVKGLVLLDPAHERQLETFPKDFGIQFTTLIPCILKAYEKLAWTGLLQFLDRYSLFNFPPIFFMDPPQREACARLYSEGSVWQRVALELEGCVDSFQFLQEKNHGEEIREGIQDIPTALVIAGDRKYSPTLFPRAVTQAFIDMHKVSLPKARQFLARKSDHWIHLQQPEVVLKALDYVLDPQQQQEEEQDNDETGDWQLEALEFDE